MSFTAVGAIHSPLKTSKLGKPFSCRSAHLVFNPKQFPITCKLQLSPLTFTLGPFKPDIDLWGFNISQSWWVYLNLFGFCFAFSICLSHFTFDLSPPGSGLCLGMAPDNPWSLFSSKPILSFHNTEPGAVGMHTWGAYICGSTPFWAGRWFLFVVFESVFWSTSELFSEQLTFQKLIE